MLHSVYSANIATLSFRRSKRNVVVEEGAAAAAGCARWRPCGAGLWACIGLGRALGNHTLANQHELASNKECTRTCCCRACWNGTGTASNRASCNGSGRSLPKYAKNMQLYGKNMEKICIYVDCISQICKRYEQNMPELCLNMQYAVIC